MKYIHPPMFNATYENQHIINAWDVQKKIISVDVWKLPP